MSLHMTSEERVARGAAWLDGVTPGWERKVDLSILAISDTMRCVCGQVFMAEAWSYARANYTDSGLTGFDYALIVLDGEPFTEMGFYWPEDGDAWAALIKDRFDRGALSDTVTA